jgi:xanthosine utilization system XapX-like protein
MWWIHPYRFGHKIETAWSPRIGGVNASALSRAQSTVGLGVLIMGLDCVATISVGVIVSIAAGSPAIGESAMMWGFLGLGVGAILQLVGLRQRARTTDVVASRMHECDPHITHDFVRQVLRSPVAFDRWWAQHPESFSGGAGL